MLKCFIKDFKIFTIQLLDHGFSEDSRTPSFTKLLLFSKTFYVKIILL